MHVSGIDLLLLTVLPVVLAMLVVPFLKKLPKVLTSEKGRYVYIEPLRGIASSLVIVCHSFLSYNFFLSSKWSPVSNLASYSNAFVLDIIKKMGGLGVIVFFMITSFLFFDKILKSKGGLDIRRFFISRFFRITPLYFFVVSLGLVVVCFTGVSSIHSGKDIATSLISWFSFGFMSMANISSIIPHGLIFAGVFWTLAIEWKFYLIVPMLSAFNGKVISTVSVFIAFLVVYALYEIRILDEYVATTLVCFIMGMIASLTVNGYIPVECISKKLFNFLASISIGLALFYIASSWAIYKVVPSIFIGIVFIFICNGFSCFGFLKLKALSFLGVISYSTYLIHGICYFLVNGVFLVGGSLLVNTFVAILLTILLSSFTYVLIEHKFIIIGRNVAERWKDL